MKTMAPKPNPSKGTSDTGIRLVKLRKKLGKTLSEDGKPISIERAAKIIGTTRSTWNRWENGKEPSPAFARLISLMEKGLL